MAGWRRPGPDIRAGLWWGGNALGSASEGLGKRQQDGQPVRVYDGNRVVADPQKDLTGLAVTPATTGFSAPSLENPLDAVAAFDDAPAIMHTGNNGGIVVGFFCPAKICGR